MTVVSTCVVIALLVHSRSTRIASDNVVEIIVRIVL